MADRRTVRVHARVSPAELADWLAKSAAVGVPLSDLLRQAMARTRTWAAAAADVERERTRQVARIGNNLDQRARWANTHAAAAEAVEVIANLVSFERSLLTVARVGGEVHDAHYVPPARHRLRTCGGRLSRRRLGRGRARARGRVELLPGNPDVEAAYPRSDLFERRRRLMNDWSAYLDGARGRVVAFHSADTARAGASS